MLLALCATLTASVATAGTRAMAVGAGDPAAEGEAPPPVSAVVELFTSQGCSSCPPADRLFETYVKRLDIVAISLPVDIWDYLGWADTLASPRNTARQRSYAKQRGDGAVYTPQIVVNGVAHAVGSDQSQIERQIAKTTLAFAQRRVPIKFWRTSSMVMIEAAAAAPDSKPRPATIWLAAVEDHVDVEIQRGENRGRAVRYFNVVRELIPVGLWAGEAVQVSLPAQAVLKPGVVRYAVLLQEGTTGPILGAAWLGL
ncbi:MAG: DUF1223 domain-containing protein [Hyphomicrobiaceae bacterium]